jgi:ABC-type sugar transport system ATPase subunit
MTAAVELRDVVKRFGTTTVLSGVSLSCPSGRVHALVGENGAGKSTLLKVLGGSVRPDAGTLTVGGDSVDLSSLTPQRTQRLGISVVHQEFALIPAMTVAENVFLGHEPRSGGRLDSSRMREESAQLLQRLGSRLSPDARVERLSVADAQIVEIAKALSLDARVLALDEPSAVLSGHELETLYAVVEKLRDDGVAVLYVSHRMDELARLCDDYTVLKDGVVAGSGRMSDVSRDQIVRMMVGRDVQSVFPARDHELGPVRLEVRHLLVPGLRRPISLKIAAGEVVGLAGLGGSGRSRLAKALTGSTAARGELFVDGKPVGPFRSPRQAMRHGIAYIPEDRKRAGLALSKSVAQNATLLRLDTVSRSGFLSRARERTRTRALVERFSIRTGPTGQDLAGQLSGGNQQKVVLAKWMELAPRIVVLDEPTRGVDVGSKEQIYDFVREMAATGVAFLLISSELVEVLGLSDRILVMADGALVDELPAGASEEQVMRCITTSALPVQEAS